MNGDHSSLLILKVDFIFVKNSMRKLNIGCVKTKWSANSVFTQAVINEHVKERVCVRIKCPED